MIAMLPALCLAATVPANGSACGDPAWFLGGDQPGAQFGYALANAGDVNGDGFDDVIVGAFRHTENRLRDGRASLYLGSANGLATTPVWHANGGLDGAAFGWSVDSAGDVNGDGFDDVIVGAPFFGTDQSEEGRAYVYLGSPTGLAADPAWIAEGNQLQSWFGFCVSGAGDVDADGFDDVLVGAILFDGSETDEGRGFLFRGSANGPSSVPDWTADGGQTSAHFAESIATAGDVNGDGFDDVIVGAYRAEDLEIDEGMAFVFLGSSVGLASAPAWSAASDQAHAQFGESVASAGDVNGDGFDDILVGAAHFDDGEADEGCVFLYLGSAGGLSLVPAWSKAGDQEFAQYGESVSPCGDVNGDGFDDVVVGAYLYDDGEANEGLVHVFLGAASGLSSTPLLTANGDQIQSWFGGTVADGGDVNGDGFDDVLVGAYLQDDGEVNEGLAYLFTGGSPADCNGNGVADDCELLLGTSTDQDADGVPDECAPISEGCTGSGTDVPGCTPCPCGNAAPPGTFGGCLNRAGTSAVLTASGTPSALSDSLRFLLQDANPGTFAVLVSGSTALPSDPTHPCHAAASGAISTVLNGLRCVGGALLRHGTRATDASGLVGVTNQGWGPPNAPAQGILSAAAFVPGQRRHFQVFYRELAFDGCDQLLNTSQRVSVTILE